MKKRDVNQDASNPIKSNSTGYRQQGGPECRLCAGMEFYIYTNIVVAFCRFLAISEGISSQKQPTFPMQLLAVAFWKFRSIRPNAINSCCFQSLYFRHSYRSAAIQQAAEKVPGHGLMNVIRQWEQHINNTPKLFICMDTDERIIRNDPGREIQQALNDVLCVPPES